MSYKDHQDTFYKKHQDTFQYVAWGSFLNDVRISLIYRDLVTYFNEDYHFLLMMIRHGNK